MCITSPSYAAHKRGNVTRGRFVFARRSATNHYRQSRHFVAWYQPQCAMVTRSGRTVLVACVSSPYQYQQYGSMAYDYNRYEYGRHQQQYGNYGYNQYRQRQRYQYQYSAHDRNHSEYHQQCYADHGHNHSGRHNHGRDRF